MEVGTVQLIDIENEMRSAYLDYAMSIIVSRCKGDGVESGGYGVVSSSGEW